MKVKVIFRWYDFWVGLFFDRNNNFLYFFPIPMVGLVFNFRDSNTFYTEDRVKVGNEEGVIKVKYFEGTDTTTPRYGISFDNGKYGSGYYSQDLKLII